MYSPISSSAAVLLFFSFVTLGQTYIIDDTNSTVQYYGNSTHFGGSTWIHDATEDKTLFFNGSDSECFCLGSEACGLKIPFTGYGITVYGVLFGGVNASLAVDGGLPHLYTHDGSCAFNTHPGCHNVSIYDIQSLTLGNHTLEIKVVSWNDTFSDFDFDYAVINDTSSSAVATTTSPASPTGTSTPPKHSSRKTIAAAIGGALGGLAAISVIVFAVLCLRKRNYLKVPPSDADCQRIENDALALRVDPLLPPRPTTPDGSTLANPPSDTHETTGSLPISISIKNVRNATAPHISTKSTPPTAQDPAPINDSVVAETTGQTLSSAGHGLNARQVDSLHSLLRQNIPGPVVATVMESMLSGEASPTGDRGLRVVIDAAAPSGSEMSPPAYEESPSREDHS